MTFATPQGLDQTKIIPYTRTMTATESNFELYSVLSDEQKAFFFPYVIGYMGEKMDPKAFAEAFVRFCQDPTFRS